MCFLVERLVYAKVFAGCVKRDASSVTLYDVFGK